MFSNISRDVPTEIPVITPREILRNAGHPARRLDKILKGFPKIKSQRKSLDTLRETPEEFLA